MAFDQYFAQEWKSISAAAAESENTSGCFDCNICLDYAHDPVVTLCGHLYCWPCIYKWFHIQSASLASDEHPQCPVCKAEVSHTTVVPLYGRGQTPSEPELQGKSSPHLGVAIPPRPPACGTQALITTSSHSGQQLPYRNPYQNQQYSPHPYGSFEEDSSPPIFNLGGSTAMGVSHPVMGMFGEMVYARVFGNSESLYSYPNSYHLVGSSSPRLRRQEMQAEKSLNRISIFLFCCFFLCLLLF
uniref:E3 ubiquitin-protein ligase RMA n=1 Tax=Davidia involucrata TaxID=16924 RepID=A0A5B6ZUQ2_DAVIN